MNNDKSPLQFFNVAKTAASVFGGGGGGSNCNCGPQAPQTAVDRLNLSEEDRSGFDNYLAENNKSFTTDFNAAPTLFNWSDRAKETQNAKYTYDAYQRGLAYDAKQQDWRNKNQGGYSNANDYFNSLASSASNPITMKGSFSPSTRTNADKIYGTGEQRNSSLSPVQKRGCNK